MTLPAQHGARSRRAPGRLGLALALALSVGLFPGCGGGDQATPPDAVATTTEAVPAALAAETWPVRMADATARAPFESHAGWALLFQRKHDEAIGAFDADRADGRGLARTHLELSALYRQAALLAGRAAADVYGESRVDQDPAAGGYLMAVGLVLDGHADQAGTALAAAGNDGPEALQAAAAGWRSWLQAGAAWPPDAALTAVPGAPGEVTPGQLPSVGTLPHYVLTERSDEARAVETSDPTSLYLLSRWHEAAARSLLAPDEQVVVDAWLAPWRLPGEAHDPVAAPASIDDAWLFGGFLLSSADLGFLEAASRDGVAAVDAWKDRSPLAACVAPAIVDGQVVPDRMLDQAAWLGQQLEAEMVRVGGGEAGFHGPFAQVARVAALRAGMVVADANGQFRDAGVLRINALDRSIETAADPVFLASVAAWDVGNRNALRAQELVHRLVRRYPPVEAVRYPLDALHIRLSRNAAPAAPVH